LSAIIGMPEVAVSFDAQGRRVLTHAEASTVTPEA
jgi:hypothetical protein